MIWRSSIFCQRKFNTRSSHLKNGEQTKAWPCILLIWTLAFCGLCILVLGQIIFSLFFFFRLSNWATSILLFTLCCTYHVLTSTGISFPIIASSLQETECWCMLLFVLLSFGVYFLFGFCYLVWWELRELMYSNVWALWRLTLGLKAKFLSWKTGQKGKWRVILTFSLFQLPWITSKKYMFRIKTGYKCVPTSTLFTGLQDNPPRTCFSLFWAIESPVYLDTPFLLSFLNNVQTFWNAVYSTQYIAIYVWIYLCACGHVCIFQKMLMCPCHALHCLCTGFPRDYDINNAGWNN